MRPIVYHSPSAIAFLNFKSFSLEMHRAGHHCESTEKQEKM